ncbi:MAG: metallophosphoesterase [Clostridia bacterium]
MVEEKKTKKNNAKFIISIILIIIIGIFLMFIILLDNKNVDYEQYNINYSGQNSSVNIKIAQLSDLHFPNLKVDTDKMIDKLKEENVDLIAITGDIIDGRSRFDTCGVVDFIDKIIGIAPIYYVNGNHEIFHRDAKELYRYLTDNGIIFLENESKNITIKGKNITIIGLIDDVKYESKYLDDNLEAKDNYKILLAHRPENWESYSNPKNSINPNLVLVGHAHGGQVRMFGQGLYAPDQGWFPEYDSGIYSISNEEDVKMIVSRGLGNSIIKNRFNNKPHIPIINIAL